VPSLVTMAAIVVGCFAAGFLGGALDSELTEVIGPSVVVAAGLLVFAWLGESVVLAVLGASLGAAAAALAVTGVEAERAGLILALIFGTAWVATGLAYRRTERPRA